MTPLKPPIAMRLDLQRGLLVCGDRPIPLRPKTWSVLVYLANRPGTLVSKDELLDAVWPDVAITDETVAKSISELRAALGDDHRRPRFIETVNRRGYRFLADLEPEMPVIARASAEIPARPFVGREAELLQLATHLASAHAGERQLVFVNGTPGVGKTALLEAFLESSGVRAQQGALWVARAGCIERHGPPEPYQPLLDALGDLARSPAIAARLVPLIRRSAPMWLVQMPWLIGDTDAQVLRRSLAGVRPERMPREFAALLDAITAEHTLLLAIEDLHWSDPFTIDVLAMLAMRPGRQRLLVIGTCRAAEAVARDQILPPALHTLMAHRHGAQIPLHALSKDAVREYLTVRFPGHHFPPELADLVYSHTDGQPLFVVAILDHMVSRGSILATRPGWALSAAPRTIELGVPDDVRHMIETQLSERSPGERAILELTSIAGGEISARIAAAVLGSDPVDVEQQCETLTRAAHFLRVSGTVAWPDGSETARYGFIHQLHCVVAREGVPAERQARLRQRLGEATEAAYAGRAAELAPQLAAHFRDGGDPARAGHYLMLAGLGAQQRFAGREAIAQFEAALAMVARVPDAAERRRRELAVRLALGRALADHEGFAAESVRVNYERVSALCEPTGDERIVFEALYARWYLHAQRGERRETKALVAELPVLADRLGTIDEVVLAESALVRTALYEGRFAAARPHMEVLLARERERPRSDAAACYGVDPVIAATMHYASIRWFLGDPGGARATARVGLTRARESGNSLFVAAALTQAGMVELLRRDGAEAATFAAEAVAIAGDQGFTFWHAYASLIAGGALVEQGQAAAGSVALATALDAMRATGARILTFACAFLAEGHMRAGALDAAEAVVDSGVAQAADTLSCGYEPELWRLRGELSLARGGDWTRTQGYLRQALEMAQEAGAEPLALRAATSLARAWDAHGRTREANGLLRETLRRCASQANSPDHAAARAFVVARQR